MQQSSHEEGALRHSARHGVQHAGWTSLNRPCERFPEQLLGMQRPCAPHSVNGIPAVWACQRCACMKHVELYMLHSNQGAFCADSAHVSNHMMMIAVRTLRAGCYSAPFAEDPAATRGNSTTLSGGKVTRVGPWAAGTVITSVCDGAYPTKTVKSECRGGRWSVDTTCPLVPVGGEFHRC